MRLPVSKTQLAYKSQESTSWEMRSSSFVSSASVVDAGHAQSPKQDKKSAGLGQIAARPTNIATQGQATPSHGRLGKHAKRKVAERDELDAGSAGAGGVPGSTASVAIQEEDGHKAGKRKKQKGSGGKILSGSRGKEQCARGEGTTGAVAGRSLAAAAAQGSQPGLPAPEQKKRKQKHDAKHEQGQQPEAEQLKLRKKRNRNKFKQPDEGRDAAVLYHLHSPRQPPVDKSNQGPQDRHEQDTLRKKRNKKSSKQRDEAGQAAAHQSLQAKGLAQQGLQQHPSCTQAPEVPELDHGLSGNKQAVRKKQSIYEADAQGNKLGVKAGKGTREQNGQHTTGKQTAIPNSLKGPWKAGKHAMTQEGQLGRRHAGPGSLSAAGQSRPKQDSLLSNMRAKLSGSQFRWLNEQLYTCPGSQAFELMQEQPELFTQYHEASPCFRAAQSFLSCSATIYCAAAQRSIYQASSSTKYAVSPPSKAQVLSTPSKASSRPVCAELDTRCAVNLHATRQQSCAPCLQGFKQQTAKWPLQPIQAAASFLHRQSNTAVVADFGCGDAELARMVPQETVHSLDLVSSAPGVIACNMAHTPLGKRAGLLMQLTLNHALLPVLLDAQVECHASSCHAMQRHRCGGLQDELASHLRQTLHAYPQETTLTGSTLQTLD